MSTDRSASDGDAGTGDDRPEILVVEDDADAAEAMRRLLVRDGAAVAIACTGEDALALAGARAPDLVLADIALPDANGVEIVAALRRRLSGARPIFIALSGSERAIEEAQRRGAGFDRCLVKPIEPATLREMVEAARRHRAGGRASDGRAAPG